VDAVHDGESQGMRPLGLLAEGATTAVSRGIAVTGETMGLWQELLGIAVGSSDIAPAKGDRRFADPAWLQNPAFHRLGQSYLVFSATLGRLVDAFDSDPANWRQAEKARFAVNLLVSSLARLVNPPGNPNASYFAGGKPGADPDAWLGTAEKRTGTWQGWADWGIGHSGSQRPAPEQPGSAQYPPLDPAPGRYVTDGGPR
jgi:hypothetical protein